MLNADRKTKTKKRKIENPSANDEAFNKVHSSLKLFMNKYIKIVKMWLLFLSYFDYCVFDVY